MATSWINFNENLHLSWSFEIKLMWLITTSNLFSNVNNAKMSILTTLCIKRPTTAHKVKVKQAHVYIGVDLDLNVYLFSGVRGAWRDDDDPEVPEWRPRGDRITLRFVRQVRHETRGNTESLYIHIKRSGENLLVAHG